MEDRLRLLAHALWSANDCITITVPYNRLLYVNEAFLRTYEYSEEELIGQPAEILRAPRAVVDDILAAAIAGESWRGELWNRTKSGREFPISLATSQVRDEQGKLLALVGVASDISARRKAEEEHQALREQYLQAQKLESVGRLAGGVAHDFNNLLTVIGGYTRLISGKITPQHPFHHPITAIGSAADRAASLTRQLLTFSRGGPGNAKTLCLDDLVTGMESMLKRLIGEEIEIHFSPGAQGGCIHADPGQVEQVIMNLAVNASDAMPDGGSIHIETSCCPVTDEFAALCLSVPIGNYVRLTVTDTGLGMSPEVTAHIFEPFFTTKDIGKGTGLGLSTAYGIVKQSGGTISVHSLEGYGSTFRVFFPAVETVNDAALPVEPVNEDATGTETILVVEDETAVRQYLQACLSERGYRVLEAEDGASAIAVARNHPGEIHLLLTDLALPGINGFEIAREVCAIRPGLPVLHMSGYPDRYGRVTDEAAYIQKPFVPATLLARIRALLDSRLGVRTR